MKTNLFKTIFLLTNLISSVSSSNNYSLPLPTELKMGQNVSELVERGLLPKVFLSGGIGVNVFTFRDEGSTTQRECTLSFPVRDISFRELGYLTSWNCGNGDVFVGDTKVGLAIRPANFDAEKGLDYTFVKVFKGYWNGGISSNVAFNEVFAKNRFDFLPMTVPIQPLVDATVCAYGGGGRFTCGAIMDLNTVVWVSIPWGESSGGTHTEDRFFGAVKVLMEKDYQPSDLGAPVYIPGQVPFQSQLFVAPVGMVIENIGKDSQKNIWYYIPIKRILKDSGLELLLGDFKHSN